MPNISNLIIKARRLFRARKYTRTFSVDCFTVQDSNGKTTPLIRAVSS